LTPTSFYLDIFLEPKEEKCRNISNFTYNPWSTVRHMSSAVAKATKPMMRGYLAHETKKRFAYSFLFATVNCALFHFYVVEPRKDAYRNFYATYDPDADFARMKKTGIFKGLPEAEEAEAAEEEGEVREVAQEEEAASPLKCCQQGFILRKNGFSHAKRLFFKALFKMRVSLSSLANPSI
jgi:cytochrome c oxidase subunit 6c